MSADFDNILFDMPKSKSNSIKVIGVGGGGSNAVNHMFTQDIKGVDFVICNTDAQALENSPIPNKIQLGANLTSGLGAGANPEVGEQAARESMEEIQQMLNTQTKMVFITAGMGGGTGTGAAPIIAKIAKDMNILTVGIVTMPFLFEGKRRSKQAQSGIDALRENVDSLIVINNNKLREVYGNLGFKAGFSKADEVLSTAARGIAVVITHHYKQNIDLHDAKTVLSNSGTAIMGSAKEEGTNRAKNAIIKALDSPLLNDNKITGAKNVLLLIVSGTNEVTLDEIGEINDYIQTEAGYDANIIMGIGEDNELGDAISVTVVATGFAADQQNAITNTETKKIVHILEEGQKATYDFSDEKMVSQTPITENPLEKSEERITYPLEDDSSKISISENRELLNLELIPTTDLIKNINVVYEEISTEEIFEGDFIITNVSQKKEHPATTKEDETSTDLLFDFPLNKAKEQIFPEAKTPIELTEDILNMEVNDLEEIRAKSDDSKKTYFVLKDSNAVAEPTIEKSSSGLKNEEILEGDEFEFELKSVQTKEVINEIPIESEEISPLSFTIEELKKRADERRLRMNRFNYKFTDQAKKNIEDLEKQPAYKRRGVEIDSTEKAISKSKTSLTKDDDDDIQPKSSNSFLHDNVD